MCSKLGRISLIDILDTVAPLSTHILSLTPSAPWLNSSLAHEQRQNRWSGHLHFPSLKKKKISNRILVSSRRQNDALTHLASRQWWEVITEVNPHETDPSSAWWRQAEIENHAACKSDFPNMSLAKYAFIQNYKKSFKAALMYHRIQHHSEACAVYSILIILKQASNMEENTSQLSSTPISISTVHPL